MRLGLKWRALRDALQKGDEVEFRFTADDLNAWFFADGKNADLIPHLRFRTIDDWLVAEVSVPLSFMAEIPMLPSFRNRFFNGKIAGPVGGREERIEDHRSRYRRERSSAPVVVHRARVSGYGDANHGTRNTGAVAGRGYLPFAPGFDPG